MVLFKKFILFFPGFCFAWSSSTVLAISATLCIGYFLFGAMDIPADIVMFGFSPVYVWKLDCIFSAITGAVLQLVTRNKSSPPEYIP